MKKLILLAGAAALIIPAAAMAADDNVGTTTTSSTNATAASKPANHKYYHTYRKANLNHQANANNSQNGQEKVKVMSEENFRTPQNLDRTFDLKDGEKISIVGLSAYKVGRDGYRAFAPTGSYMTTGGQTVVVRDGQLDRIETRPNVVSFNWGK